MSPTPGESSTALAAPNRAGEGTGVPALTRKEAEGIRMRTADPEVVRVWFERASRIKAVAPPPEGPLTANQTGWLLARGNVHTRLWPGFVRWVSGGSVAFGVTVGLLKGMFRRLLRFAPGIAVLAIAVGVGVGLGVRQLLTTHKLRGWRRRARALLASDQLADVPLVRVVGRIAAQPTVATLFLGRPAVLFRNRVGDADETRGIDFQLQLDDQTEITIDVREVLLLDEPMRITHPPLCGPVSALTVSKGEPRLHSDFSSPPPFWTFLHHLHESSVGPGDVVEIIGHAERVGEAPAPARLVLFGTAEIPLQVRQVALSGARSAVAAPAPQTGRSENAAGRP